jgi:hypothetical protein
MMSEMPQLYHKPSLVILTMKKRTVFRKNELMIPASRMPKDEVRSLLKEVLNAAESPSMRYLKVLVASTFPDVIVS